MMAAARPAGTVRDTRSCQEEWSAGVTGSWPASPGPGSWWGAGRGGLYMYSKLKYRVRNMGSTYTVHYLMGGRERGALQTGQLQSRHLQDRHKMWPLG